MKIVAISDFFITTDMMKTAIENEKYLSFDKAEYFYFGLNTKAEMRDIVKKIERKELDDLALPDGLLEAVKDTDIIICHLCPITKKVLDCCANLKYILCNRGGKENIDIAECEKRGIKCLFNPAHNANAVADFTVGLILNETRNISRSHIAITNGEWRERYPNTDSQIHEMKDLTIGIIGFGTIGKLVYKKLSSFGCKFLVNNPSLIEKVDPTICEQVSKDYLIRHADVITLHARIPEKTCLIGKDEFDRMKDTAYVINTARPYLMDYNALADALIAHKIKGACVDVFNKEPAIEDNRLIGLDNCTLTNHQAGNTINSYSDSPEMMLKVLAKLIKK